MAWLKGAKSGDSIVIAKPVTFTKTITFSGTANYFTTSVTLTNSQIKNMRATPVQIVAAPGANKYIEFICARLFLDYGSNALTESTANMAIRYTGGSGIQVSQTIESTGFIDATADTYTNALAKIDCITTTAQLINQPLFIKNEGAGEFAGNAGNDTTMKIYVCYRVHSIA